MRVLSMWRSSVCSPVAESRKTKNWAMTLGLSVQVLVVV